MLFYNELKNRFQKHVFLSKFAAMKYKTLIFDFDGTLANTTTGIVRVYQETFRQMGFPVPDEELIKGTIGLVLKESLKVGLEGMTDEQADEAIAVYRRIFLDIATPCTVAFPGVAETIEKLHDMGYVLAIATSRSHHSLEILAEQIGVAKYFSGLYGAEDVKNHKPAPDLALLALEKTGTDCKDALVIGDATYDLLMGKGAGCEVCGVTWGNQGREKLMEVKPDYLIDHIEELLNIV